MYTIMVQYNVHLKPKPTPTLHTCIHIFTHSKPSPLRTLWGLNFMSLLQRFQVKSTCTLSHYVHIPHIHIMYGMHILFTHINVHVYQLVRSKTFQNSFIPLKKNKNEQNKYQFNLEPSFKVSTSEEKTITGLYSMFSRINSHLQKFHPNKFRPDGQQVCCDVTNRKHKNTKTLTL